MPPIPFSFIKSSGGAVFDPATLSLSGWWRTDFASSPWTSTASAGASNGRTLTEATNPPSVGTALNGHNPVSFDGTNDTLSTPTVIESDLFTASAGAGWALYKASSPPASGGAAIFDPGFLQGQGAYFGAGVNSTGPAVYINDGGAKNVQITTSSNAWHLFQWKWDGTNLKARVDSNSWTSLACGNVGDQTSKLNCGPDYSGTVFTAMLVAEVAAAAYTISDADFDNVRSYINSRYALSI